MLHIAVIEHGADTCAAVHSHIGDLARQGLGDLQSIAGKHKVDVQGAWGNAAAHKFFVPADAPNAHAVNDLLVEAKVFHWNTVNVFAVETMEEMMPLAAGG